MAVITSTPNVLLGWRSLSFNSRYIQPNQSNHTTATAQFKQSDLKALVDTKKQIICELVA